MTIVEPQVHTEAVIETETVIEAVIETESATAAEVAIMDAAETGVVPRPAPGVEFFGEFQGSGYAEPHYLVQRSDGQVVQLTLLLDLILRQIDGTRDLAAIAQAVTVEFGREVGADDVAYLVENRLQPVGLVAAEEDTTTTLPRTDLLLVLRGHRTLFGPRQVQFFARSLAWLHYPAIVVAVLGSVIAFDVWLFGRHGALAPVISVINRPLNILIVLGLGIASAVFHEFGHASACRYSGARPGRIGCGIFLIWPSLYTDVTDVYRVERRGRLRTDLGGVYFNTIFILGLAGAYAGTHQPVLLAAILFVHFEILDQLLPVLRFDGYFILADLAGVPDLFGRIRPLLSGLLPGRRHGRTNADLRRGARIAVTAWVALTVPLLAGESVWLVWNLPRLSRTLSDSIQAYSRDVHASALNHQWAQLSLDATAIALLLIPAIGLSWLAVRLAGRAAHAGSAALPRLRPKRRGRHRR